MNDTLEIPVEISWAVGQSAAGGGGLGIEHLILFAIICAVAVLAFMFMSLQGKTATKDAIDAFRHEEANSDKLRDLLERQKDMELRTLTRQVDASSFVPRP